MKITFTILAIFVSLSNSFSQVMVGDVNINDRKINVIEVLVEGRFQSESVTVSVDYGQGGKNKNQQIINPTSSKEMKFNSSADLINYLENNSWKHYDTQIITKGSNVMFYYYFRKQE